MEPPLELHPAWRQAVVTFVEGDFGPGDILTHAWLFRQFRLEQPTDTTLKGEADKIQLQYLAAFKRFEKSLLQEHQIALKSKAGVGYEIVAPGEQADWAWKEGMDDLKKALGKMQDRTTNVDQAALTNSERVAWMDKSAKLANLRLMAKNARRGRLIPPAEDTEAG